MRRVPKLVASATGLLAALAAFVAGGETAIAVGMIGLLSFAGFGCKRTAVNLGVVRAMPLGSSTQAVMKALGPPTQVWSDGGTWSYYNSRVTHTVYLNFDTNLLYQSYELDD